MLALCLGRPNLGDMTYHLDPAAHHVKSDSRAAGQEI